MGLFGRSKRSAESPEQELKQVLLGAPDKTVVTEKSSLSLSAVWGCVRILSNSVGILPLHLYEYTKDGSREKVSEHAALRVLRRPNDYWTRLDLMEWLMTSVLLWGNGYARIHRDIYYQPDALTYLYPYEVDPKIDRMTGRLIYRITSTGEMLDPAEILHVKGLGTDPEKGLSPIRKHRENLALSMEAQEYGEKFFSNGGNTSGVFEHPGTLKDDQFKRLKNDLKEQTAGLRNAHAPLLLEGGLKYTRINIPLEDAQFIATRKFQTSEIAVIFGVPPHMLGNLDKATYNNTELMGIEYVTYSLMPWLQRIQLELDRKLLLESEQGKKYFKFGVNGLMRGDSKSRSEYYKNMSLIGAMSANEIRELEDMNSYPDGDKYYVQLNMQPADRVGMEDNE